MTMCLLFSSSSQTRSSYRTLHLDIEASIWSVLRRSLPKRRVIILISYLSFGVRVPNDISKIVKKKPMWTSYLIRKTFWKMCWQFSKKSLISARSLLSYRLWLTKPLRIVKRIMCSSLLPAAGSSATIRMSLASKTCMRISRSSGLIYQLHGRIGLMFHPFWSLLTLVSSTCQSCLMSALIGITTIKERATLRISGLMSFGRYASLSSIFAKFLRS